MWYQKPRKTKNSAPGVGFGDYVLTAQKRMDVFVHVDRSLLKESSRLSISKSLASMGRVSLL